MNDLIDRLNEEADLCQNEGATDIAALLWEAAKALSARSVGEAPVMWQYRVYHDDPDDAGWGIWHECHDASTATRLQGDERYQVRPLYTSPAPAVAVPDRSDMQIAVSEEKKVLDSIDFPIDQLDWLIACLERIRAEVRG